MKTIQFAVFTLFLVVLLSNSVFAKRKHHLKHSKREDLNAKKKVTDAVVSSEVTVKVEKPIEAPKEVMHSKTADEEELEKQAVVDAEETEKLDQNNLDVKHCNQTVTANVTQMLLGGDNQTNQTVQVVMNKDSIIIKEITQGKVVKMLNMSAQVKNKESVGLCQQMEFEFDTGSDTDDAANEQRIELCFESEEQREKFNLAIQKFQDCHMNVEPVPELKVKNEETTTVIQKPHKKGARGPAAEKFEKYEQQPKNLLEHFVHSHGMHIARGDSFRVHSNSTTSKPRHVDSGFLVRNKPVDLFANN